ncbi:hypothetical protein KF201_1103 [Lactococcus lactis subsp. lactis]|nr:hypothetical protein KF201_1103 [Lactococcus lactis subsp. lactis]
MFTELVSEITRIVGESVPSNIVLNKILQVFFFISSSPII